MINLVQMYCTNVGDSPDKKVNINTFKLRYVPVVDSKENMNLLFLVKISELKDHIEEYIGPIDANKEKSLALKNQDKTGLRLVKIKTKDDLEGCARKELSKNLLDNNKEGTIPQYINEMNPARYILSMCLRHIPPQVVYLDSPLSYMAEGQADKFYQGEGENTSAAVEDPSVLAYCVI